MKISRAKQRIILGAGFVLLFVAAARSQQPAVRELAPGVFFWQGDHVLRKPANCTWVVFKDYVLVIDANFPWAAREILAEIRRTTDKPVRFVFNTHYHSDHTFGNSVFVDAGASVVSSQECAADFRARGKAAWDRWKDTGGHSLTGSRLEYPSMTFADKLIFDDGEHRVELIKVGPGHTKGDAVAYLPKEQILATGDLCVNWTWGNNVGDVDADYDGWIRILDELARWDVQILVPGHGSLGTTETLRGQREYISDMLQQVRAGLRAGKTADQLASEIDLSKHGSFGSDQHAPGMSNASSIRAMYRKVAAGGRVN
jgi:glyoxylase-like metal-dependent hydrolase (beta-lactamase superfamily II)